MMQAEMKVARQRLRVLELSQKPGNESEACLRRRDQSRAARRRSAYHGAPRCYANSLT
jgi:hypothetical protein